MRPTNMAPQNLDVPCSTFFPLSPLDPTGRLLDSRGHRGRGIRSVPGGFKNVAATEFGFGSVLQEAAFQSSCVHVSRLAKAGQYSGRRRTLSLKRRATSKPLAPASSHRTQGSIRWYVPPDL